jgi:hypothetical protein
MKKFSDTRKSKSDTSYYRDKFKSGTEFSSSEEEQIEGEGIEIKDNVIIIQTKDKHKFEISYGFARTIEGNTRIIFAGCLLPDSQKRACVFSQ